MSKMTPLELLTIDDVADLFQVSPKTVRRWIQAGELVAAKLGNQWRIDLLDAKRFFVERLSR
jgi:excisionase family DNA binding protein